MDDATRKVLESHRTIVMMMAFGLAVLIAAIVAQAVLGINVQNLCIELFLGQSGNSAISQGQKATIINSPNNAIGGTVPPPPLPPPLPPPPPPPGP